MNRRFRPLTCFFSLAVLVALSDDAVARTRHKQIQHAGKANATTKVGHQRHAAHKKGKHVATARHKPAPPVDKPAQTATTAPLTGDLAAVKQAIDLARKGKTGEATIIEKPSAIRWPRSSSNGSSCATRMVT
jgi:soluble lytic murein transglycosylase